MDTLPTTPTPGAAIVTGASRGLGLGIAQALALAGRPVVLAARGEDDVRRAAEAIGAAALAVPADVTVEADVARLVALAHERFGAIDVVVNNAGAPPVLDPLERLTWERFAHGLDVDVRAAFLTTRAVAPSMRARGGGTIVNVIAARGGTLSSPAHLSYSTAQAALAAFSRCTARVLAPDGVAVHGLYPALTPAGGVGRAAAAALGVTFDGEILTAAQVGEAVVDLLSEPRSAEWSLGPDGLAALTAGVAA